MLNGRHAAAIALREVLRELYPAALRAYPDPAHPLAMAVLDALPEPGRLTVRGGEPTQTAEEVVAALDAGLVDLSDSDADPRKAVIACWVRLEQAAAAAGVERRPGDTPTELVTRLLGADRPVSADVLAAFAEVYREARYATHTVDERMRTQARSALQRLRTELTSTRVTP